MHECVEEYNSNPILYTSNGEPLAVVPYVVTFCMPHPHTEKHGYPEPHTLCKLIQVVSLPPNIDSMLQALK
jgi:hypothetical protein